MRKLAAVFMAAAFLAFARTAYAEVRIDASNSERGLVQIQYDGDLSKPVKVLVEANGDKNVYSIRDNNSSFVPLQMGLGSYKISVLQNVSGNKYKPLLSQTISVSKVDTQFMFSSPSLLIAFNNKMKSVADYGELISGKKLDEKIKVVYEDIVKNYSYDFEKVKSLPSDYVPVIDEMYSQKKGICYDYSALLAGVLRSQGVPTKLVMGYAPNVKEYHAWNEILLDGQWIVVDTTYDSQLAKANMSYTFKKDASERKVVKIY
jgi:transglutaminase/protease-like cytokinesis protein 3